jgi:hypothetical protein
MKAGTHGCTGGKSWGQCSGGALGDVLGMGREVSSFMSRMVCARGGHAVERRQWGRVRCSR